jgi:hypothetical protein
LEKSQEAIVVRQHVQDLVRTHSASAALSLPIPVPAMKERLGLEPVSGYVLDHWPVEEAVEVYVHQSAQAAESD